MPGSPQNTAPVCVVDRLAVEGDVLAVRLHRRAAAGRRGSASGTARRASRRTVSAPKKSPYQTASRPMQHRQVLARAARCGSARPSRGSRRASRGSARGRSRASSTGRSPSPSSSARRPSPRSRTCSRCRCRTSRTSSAFVETATKCFATAASSPSARSSQSRADVRVRHRLERRERLRRDDEQRLGGGEVARRLDEVGAVDVRDEPERQVAVGCSGAAPRRPSPGRGRSRRCRC